MPNTLQTEQADESRREQDEHEALDKVIGEQVIHVLGTPYDLRSVQVRKVWADHYRVNIIVGANASSVKVAHSYFLTVDPNGHITTSTPTMKKHY